MPCSSGFLERLGDLAGDRECFVHRQRPLREALLQVLARTFPSPAPRSPPTSSSPKSVAMFGCWSEASSLASRSRTGEPLGVGSKRLRQPLERDVAPEAGVGGAKHLAHPARTERRDDAVGAELITCGQAQGLAPIDRLWVAPFYAKGLHATTWRGRRGGRILPCAGDSMKLRLFQTLDAFASRVFAGNPAAVVPLERWLDAATLQAIVAETDLAGHGLHPVVGVAADEIRWMTPTVEVATCAGTRRSPPAGW